MLGAVREGEGEAMFIRWVLVFALWVSLVFPTEGKCKDINLGWSGIGSWTTLPYVVAGR